jgi:hypothetical protein
VIVVGVLFLVAQMDSIHTPKWLIPRPTDGGKSSLS